MKQSTKSTKKYAQVDATTYHAFLVTSSIHQVSIQIMQLAKFFDCLVILRLDFVLGILVPKFAHAERNVSDMTIVVEHPDLYRKFATDTYFDCSQGKV